MTPLVKKLMLERDLRMILRKLPAEDRQRLKSTPKEKLILFHRTFGMYLRNQFRTGRYRWLSRHCHAVIEERKVQLSFDALSSVAIELIWDRLQRKRSHGARQ
jgi:hypothetical protein